MFATSCQLAGTVLLGYMIAFRKREKIIGDSSIQVWVSHEKPMLAKDKWIETYGYRIGFFYIIVGYLLTVIEKEIKIPVSGEIFLICFVAIVLSIIGIGISEGLGSWRFNKMTVVEFADNAPDGTVMIEFTEEELEENNKTL